MSAIRQTPNCRHSGAYRIRVMETRHLWGSRKVSHRVMALDAACFIVGNIQAPGVSRCRHAGKKTRSKMTATVPKRIVSFRASHGGTRKHYRRRRRPTPGHRTRCAWSRQRTPTVLIQGETGTGKELVARAIHDQSQRRHRRYVKINCAAIPARTARERTIRARAQLRITRSLDADDGPFSLADRGTLFLDEVGDLPLELQPKVLRVLQEQEFERLGSTHTIMIDVRIVAATNLDLMAMVRERRFRADLFYRLNVFPISIPPLRKRSGDIPDLVWHFVRKHAARGEPGHPA